MDKVVRNVLTFQIRNWNLHSDLDLYNNCTFFRNGKDYSKYPSTQKSCNTRLIDLDT